ncbi:MAG: TIGR04076 family protein [Kiritimatiellaeota bacterium]|nr:TIGR04076 family protein [Kiritimatiellota bacterium]
MSRPVYKIRIQVLKREFNKPFIDAYADSPENWTKCDKFAEGDKFVVSDAAPWEMPEGFCGWAWGDIQKIVWGMSRGGPERFVTSCTDGYRPVIFLLERMN